MVEVIKNNNLAASSSTVALEEIEAELEGEESYEEEREGQSIYFFVYMLISQIHSLSYLRNTLVILQIYINGHENAFTKRKSIVLNDRDS